MTFGVFLRRLRYVTTRGLVAVLSAYLGALICWTATVIFSPLNPHPEMSVPKSVLFLLLYSAFALVFGSTGLLLFLGLTFAIGDPLPWRNRMILLLGSTAAGFLGVALGPLPSIWLFPHERLSPSDWRFYLLGTSIGLVSACIFLLLTHRMRSRIQGTS